MSTVSVVVPCYNAAAYLSEAVASVAAQTFSSIELVLVDDGSTDDTPRVMRELAAAYPRFPITSYSHANAGVAATRNRGVGLARGDYILPLDGDDVIRPTMVADCVAVLDRHPEISIAFTDREDFGELTGTFVSGTFELARLRYFNQVPYASMYRRAVWHDVGGYRSNVDGFDDWDFWVAAALRGHRGHHLPVPHLRHRRRRSSFLASIVDDYERLFAQIILNHADAYSEDEVAAAWRYLSERVPAPILRASKQIFTQSYSLFDSQASR